MPGSAQIQLSPPVTPEYSASSHPQQPPLNTTRPEVKQARPALTPSPTNTPVGKRPCHQSMPQGNFLDKPHQPQNPGTIDDDQENIEIMTMFMSNMDPGRLATTHAPRPTPRPSIDQLEPDSAEQPVKRTTKRSLITDSDFPENSEEQKPKRRCIGLFKPIDPTKPVHPTEPVNLLSALTEKLTALKKEREQTPAKT